MKNINSYKQSLSIMLAVVLCVTGLFGSNLHVRAEADLQEINSSDVLLNNPNITFGMEKVEVTLDELVASNYYVDVDYYVINNTGYLEHSLGIYYGENGLTYCKKQVGEVLANAFRFSDAVSDAEVGEETIWAAETGSKVLKENPFNINGTIYTFTFQVPEHAAIGDVFNLRMKNVAPNIDTVSELESLTGENLSYSLVDGYIKIVDTLPTTTTTTTTTATTVTTTTASANTFAWGKDNWNFENSSLNGYFKDTPYINQIKEPYLSKLKNNLNNNEYKTVFKGSWYNGYWQAPWIGEKWGGSCYGMSSLLLLAKHDYLNYSDYATNGTCLNDLAYPINDTDVNALITYYQMLQAKDCTQSIYRQTKKESNETNIKKIISLLNTNDTVLVGFQQKNWGGHTVIAYGIEYGSYRYNGTTYQGRILTCDPNRSINKTEDCFIYFNTSTYNWMIPLYYKNGVYSANGAIINYVGADSSTINYGGYLNSEQVKPTTEFVASLEMASISNNHSINKVSKSGASYVNMNTSADDITPDIIYNFQSDTNSEGTAGYIINDNNAAYKICQSTPLEMNLTMKYENSIFDASSDAGSEIIFDNNGYVSVSGESSDYSIGMTYNEGYYPTDWFFMGVSGNNANKAEMQQLETGYLLKSDNLKNVKVDAFNRDVEATVSFSTDYYDVFLYEIDENTIGVAVDTDSDGIYETTIATSDNHEIDAFYGDLNLDATVSLADLVTYQKYLRNVLHFNDQQFANANCDSTDMQLNDQDATALMKFLIGTIASLPVL